MSFIGGGVMAEAIISGMKEAALDVNIYVSEPIPERASYLESVYGVQIVDNNVKAVEVADLVVLAVKPQQLSEVADEVRCITSNRFRSDDYVDNGWRADENDHRTSWVRSCDPYHGKHSSADRSGCHCVDRRTDSLG